MQARETILVADDEALVRKMVCRTLKKHGYEVLEAADAAQALEILDSTPTEIHLLLTDIVMPNMNGRDLARKLRERRPSTKVIFMSGYAEPEVISALPKDADHAFLPKVFTPNHLLNKLRQILSA